MSSETPNVDFLVLGSGIAGLSFALQAASHGRVAVLCKGDAELTNTSWAQGGIAAVWSPDDSLDAHVEDTLAAGADFADREVVSDILADGRAAVEQLISWGIRFDRGEASATDFDLTMEGGHSARRILHSGDITGAEIQRGLLAAVQDHPRVELFEGHVAIDLITERKVRRHQAKKRLGLVGGALDQRYGPGGPEGWMPGQRDRCLGAYVLEEATGRVHVFRARSTVLATRSLPHQ